MFNVITKIFMTLVLGSLVFSPASVFGYDQSTSAEIERLVADDAAAGARFGVSIASDGDIAVVGAPGAFVDGESRGAAYLYNRQDEAWVQVGQLIASDGNASDGFGTAVAIAGDTIVVGAPSYALNGMYAGAAYVFTRNGSRWSESAILVPSIVGDIRFGFSVAVDGDTIAVGAPYTDSGFTNSGAVYIFETDENGWTETTRLATGASGAVLSDLFGWSVALKDNLLVIGAYLGDMAHIYERDDAGWQKTATLRGDDTHSRDRFGYAVATDGSRVVVGATQDNDTGVNSGTAFIFRLDNDGWQQEAKLMPTTPFPTEGTNFGWSVTIAGDTAVVGAANSKGAQDTEESGAVYVYAFDGSLWEEVAFRTASDASVSDYLGRAVAISANNILAGASDSDDAETDAGAVYIFDFSTP